MPHFITREGLAELQAELNKIVEIELPKIWSAINTAREEGDLKENAGYQTALKAKDELEARRVELDGILKDYEIIEEDHSKSDKNSKVSLGSFVEFKNITLEKDFKVKIVGSSESDILQSKISYESPLAQSILGKKAGNKVEYKSPTGTIKIEILKVS